MALALTIFAIVLASLALGVQLSELRLVAQKKVVPSAEEPTRRRSVNDNARAMMTARPARSWL